MPVIHISRCLDYIVRGTADQISRKYHGLATGLEQESDWRAEYVYQARDHWLRVEKEERKKK